MGGRRCSNVWVASGGVGGGRQANLCAPLTFSGQARTSTLRSSSEISTSSVLGERELVFRCRHCKVRRRAQARHNPSELPVQHPSEPLDQLASSLLPPLLSQCRRRDDEQADHETRKDAVARHFESD